MDLYKDYLKNNQLPPLPPTPYDDCIVHDNGLIVTFLSKHEALKYRKEHNYWR